MRLQLHAKRFGARFDVLYFVRSKQQAICSVCACEVTAANTTFNSNNDDKRSANDRM